MEDKEQDGGLSKASRMLRDYSLNHSCARPWETKRSMERWSVLPSWGDETLILRTEGENSKSQGSHSTAPSNVLSP